MKRESVDVLVVGSGFGGAVVAGRLAGRARVLVLEKGRRWRREDFRPSFDPLSLARIFDLFPGTGTGIVAGTGVGGGSLVYSMVSLRAPSAAFEWTDRQGRRYWPEPWSRSLLDPYYERVEAMLGVTQLVWPPGGAEAWRTVSPRDVVFARGLDRIGATCDAMPLALSDCTDCGFCSVGCAPGAKRSLDKNYLALAEARGAEIRPGCLVDAIAPAPGGGYRVRYVRTATGESAEVLARRVVLAAGAVGTAAILLAARRRGTLPRLSGHVGRNLSLNGDLALGGYVPDHAVEEFRGKVDGSITYAWWDRGFTIQCVRLPLSWLAMGFPFPLADDRGRRWGLDYKRRLRDLARHLLPLGILGRDDAEGVVRLTPGGVPWIDFRPTARTRRMWDDSIAACRRIVEEGLGGRLLPTPFESHGLIGTVHPLGTARIGDTPRRGVVDSRGEVFGHPGLHVADGAAIPGPLGVNTSLTIAAVAERLADQIGDGDG